MDNTEEMIRKIEVIYGTSALEKRKCRHCDREFYPTRFNNTNCIYHKVGKGYIPHPQTTEKRRERGLKSSIKTRKADPQEIIKAYIVHKKLQATGDQFSLSRERVRQILNEYGKDNPQVQEIKKTKLRYPKGYYDNTMCKGTCKRILGIDVSYSKYGMCFSCSEEKRTGKKRVDNKYLKLGPYTCKTCGILCDGKKIRRARGFCHNCYHAYRRSLPEERERARLNAKKWYHTHREQARAYTKKHKEIYYGYTRKWRKKNPEKLKEYSRVWNDRRRIKLWKLEHPEPKSFLEAFPQYNR